MDKPIFTKLSNLIKSFAKINFFTYSDAKDPTGLFCSCFSDIAKDRTLERIKSIIETNELPVTVDENGLERTKHFHLKFI